ncbi:MAG: isoleucine--tRNA ligase [Acidimicrobiales bacterium]|nr:isoleucine--tRNA ligase [Acidimicrobiales bacterium]
MSESRQAGGTPDAGAPGAEGREPRRYPAVSAQPDLPALEREVLAYWEEDGTFRASVEARPAGETEYVFYDGPPFANGLPHYGHLLTGFVKDAVPRYQTMRGRRVERRFGWDTHGLPAEMAAERELGLSGRQAILAHGMERFNAHCRELVLRTVEDFRYAVTRQARWVDFDNDYKTMDLSYMESVMWAFKSLWEKGLAYEGYRVLPYCWECETPLSNFETRIDDAYRLKDDPTVTVAFELVGDGEGGEEPAARPLHLLVWTTTPWTLPSNLALAVGPEFDYEVHEVDGRLVVTAAGLAARAGLVEEGTPPLAVLKGQELVGRRYRPLFPFFADTPGAFVVLATDFVTTEEGTGIVHLAPGFGEEDQQACEAVGIPVVVPVDGQGRFTAEVPPYAGQQVFDANQAITDDLVRAGALVASGTYRHSYPHCWRTDTPLIYRAMSSWFVKVSEIKDRMVELNQQITWVPEHIRDGAFGKWLEGARDWSISRNRFWGAPIPVWQSDDPRYPRTDVYGSLDELEADFGVRPDDLHRPAIDGLVRPNPDDPSGQAMMRRVEDVLDCWFESGSMPYAQLHYPFENRSRFESHFPADFIVEYVSQTRGWFYTLHVLAVALFDCPAFETCVAHGVLLGDDGRKLSKHFGNFPDPDEAFDTSGADAMRWSFLASPLMRGGDLVVDRSSFAKAARQGIHPLWNAWRFLSLYGNADGLVGRSRTDAPGVLDRYVLAKAAELVERVTAAMDASDLSEACNALTSFFEVLTNWYVRHSRDRFWRGREAGAEAEADKVAAYDTLHTVLEVVCRVAAPLLPLTTEAIWGGLTGGRSVHLCDWPAQKELPSDPLLVTAMDRAREVCSAAHSVRKAGHRHTRLPLPSLTVAASWAKDLAPLRHLIAEEVNVKEVRLQTELEEAAEVVLTVRLPVAAPRLGPETPRVLQAVKRGDWARLADGTVEVAGTRLLPEEVEVRLRPKDERTSRALPGDDAVVVIDLEVTEELEAEGLARDLVRAIQAARREAGFEVTDRVSLVLSLPDLDGPLSRAVSVHRDFICGQTLAASLEVLDGSPAPDAGTPDATGGLTSSQATSSQATVGGQRVGISLSRRAS